MFETFLGVSRPACVASPLLIMGIPSSSTKPLLLRTMPAEGTVQLAVNYSTIAADLVQTGSIDIDLFKCPDRASLHSSTAASVPSLRPVWMRRCWRGNSHACIKVFNTSQRARYRLYGIPAMHGACRGRDTINKPTAHFQMMERGCFYIDRRAKRRVLFGEPGVSFITDHPGPGR